MSDTIRIGVAGLTHGHVGGLIASWEKVPNAKLVAVADNTPLMEHHGPKFQRRYQSWREMLDVEELDALVVTSNNVESSEIAVEALGKGIPCMVEKPMAASYADAQRMLEAWRKAQKPLMINWPLAWSPWLHELKRLLDQGLIGKVFHLRFRNGHHGPKEIGCDPWFVAWLYDEKLNGAGALADFCGYGAVLCRWYFGLPQSVYAVRDNYTKDYEVPDDHAIVVLRYPKLTCILEGTWATFGFDRSANPVVHGKEGTFGVYGNDVVLFRAGQEEVHHESPALSIDNPAEYFLRCMQTGHCPGGILHPEVAADACKIIDAAKESARTGKEVPLA